MAEKKPSEVAREALLLLAARKLVPTPANYQTVYCEIAGTPAAAPFPDEALRHIAQSLPARTPEQRKQKDLLKSAIDQGKWGPVQDALIAYATADTASSPALAPAAIGDAVRNAAAAASSNALTLEQLARIIENALPALGTDDARFSEQVAQVLKLIRQPTADIAAVRTMVSNFSHRLSFTAEDQAEIRATLLKLLHLVIENIGELGADDRWLTRDFDALVAAATPPLTLRRLDDLERRLKNVMFKHIEVKGRTVEAQAQMRQMLASFVKRLGYMTEASSAYHDKMEQSARLLEQAGSLDQIAPLMRSVVISTRDLVQDVSSVRNELQSMHEKVDAAEAAIAKLQEELNAFSAEARHDTVTGALNRKGLDEALARELADVQRRASALCIALLDVDNFNCFTASTGEATGDAALSHLVTVTRECMRSQDTLARSGAEKFVILMPDTILAEAIDVMTRLQRALTRRFFLAGTEKIVITFSAGVAQLSPTESGEEAIERADQAMYLAKRAGKNRVLGA